MGGTGTISVDDHDVRLHSLVERNRIDDRLQLRHAGVRAERHREQHSASPGGQPSHPRPEQILDRLGYRQLVPEPRKPALHERAADSRANRGFPIVGRPGAGAVAGEG